MQAAEALNASVVDMRFVKPLDTKAIEDAVAKHDSLVTVEENVTAGGAGSAVLQHLADKGLSISPCNSTPR